MQSATAEARELDRQLNAARDPAEMRPPHHPPPAGPGRDGLRRRREAPRARASRLAHPRGVPVPTRLTCRHSAYNLLCSASHDLLIRLAPMSGPAFPPTKGHPMNRRDALRSALPAIAGLGIAAPVAAALAGAPTGPDERTIDRELADVTAEIIAVQSKDCPPAPGQGVASRRPGAVAAHRLRVRRLDRRRRVPPRHRPPARGHRGSGLETRPLSPPVPSAGRGAAPHLFLPDPIAKNQETSPC